MIVICPDCKKEISGDAKSCPHCGKSQETGLSKDIKNLLSTFTSLITSFVAQIVGGVFMLGAGVYVTGTMTVASKGFIEREATLVWYVIITLYTFGGLILLYSQAIIPSAGTGGRGNRGIVITKRPSIRRELYHARAGKGVPGMGEPRSRNRVSNPDKPIRPCDSPPPPTPEATISPGGAFELPTPLWRRSRSRSAITKCFQIELRLGEYPHSLACFGQSASFSRTNSA